jgi:hypothetical protein
MPNIDADIDILSVTKPIALKDYVCAWSHYPDTHSILKGHKYVRVVYEDKTGEMQSDHICVECWTKPV